MSSTKPTTRTTLIQIVKNVNVKNKKLREMKKEKKCNKCFKVKPFSEFHNCRYTSDGKQGECKQCRVKIDSARRNCDWTKMLIG